MKIVEVQTMRTIDQEAQETYRIPGLLLMERAGLGVFSFIRQTLGDTMIVKGITWVFLVGRGNNGGDALVVAREVYQEYGECAGLTCFINGDEGSEFTMRQLAICRALGMDIRYWHDPETSSCIASAHIIIDGITGNGLRTPLRESAAGLVRATARSCRQEHSTLISIDLPSGSYAGATAADPIIDADVTVVMGLPSRLLFEPVIRSNVGRMHYINPGFPKVLLDTAPVFAELIDTESPHIPRLSSASFKGTRGHAALFCGSVRFTGAARLASYACLRARSGLTSLFVDAGIYQVLAKRAKSLIVTALPEPEVVSAETLAAGYQSLLMGCGWGRESGRDAQLIEGIRSRLPLVIDADGIHVLKRIVQAGLLPGSCVDSPVLLTPHPGEWKALIAGTEVCRFSSLFDQLSSYAQTMQVSILYKSHVMVIVTPDSPPMVVDGMNPALGTAGTGDVLAGIIVGLMAQGISVRDSALIGACTLQRVGAAAREELGWFASEDLLPMIGKFL